MSLKRKQIQLRQKAYFEQLLENRLSFLSGKGVEAARIDKDPLVKKFKADVRAVNNRLRLIAANEKRTEELARIKAEKAAAPEKEKEAAKAEKPKKAPEEGKAKKPKPEKKPAAPKEPREKGGEKAPKPAAAPQSDAPKAEEKPK